MSFGYQLDLFHLPFPSTLCRLRDIRFVLSEMLQHGLCKYVWISLLAHHAHACAITIHSTPYSVYKCVLILISTFLRGSSDASPTLLRTVLIIRARLVNRCDNCLEEELPPPLFCYVRTNPIFEKNKAHFQKSWSGDKFKNKEWADLHGSKQMAHSG